VSAVEIVLSGFVVVMVAVLTVVALQVVEHIFQVRILRADVAWLRVRVDRLERGAERPTDDEARSLAAALLAAADASEATT